VGGPRVPRARKKRLREAAQQLALTGRASLLQWAVDSGQWAVTATAQVRESEIRSQEEAARLLLPARRQHAAPGDIVVAQLVRSVLEELEMFEWTGALPGGKAWSEQVWWRVELWRAFWRERDRVREGAA
jgi:hypothetical protein